MSLYLLYLSLCLSLCLSFLYSLPLFPSSRLSLVSLSPVLSFIAFLSPCFLFLLPYLFPPVSLLSLHLSLPLCLSLCFSFYLSPVSLPPFLFLPIVANSLVNHLEINNLLYDNQYGFLRGRSTLHNINKLTSKISQDLNEKKFVIGIFLDLKKAFDTVSHDILLSKLKKLGISGTPLNWFTSYNSNRTQFTEISGCKSNELAIDISVLQGSILGPILFLCFINDLHLATWLLTLLFADDTAVIDSDTDLPTLINRVNYESKKLLIFSAPTKCPSM